MTADDSERARAKLETLKHVFLAFAVVYLALHFWVAFAAWRQAGAVAAIATLVTLGFGDLYWAWSWGLGESSAGYAGEAAMVAAAMAFLSWGARPWTNRYIYRLGIQSIPVPVRDYADGADEDREDDGTDDDSTLAPIIGEEPSPHADDALPADRKTDPPSGGAS